MTNKGNFPILAFRDCFRIRVKGKQKGAGKAEGMFAILQKKNEKLMSKWVLYMAFYHDLKEIIGFL